jgi:hypothetical protein
MTGSGLAVIAIPIAGTIFLGVWLGLVFYAGGPRRVGGNLVPGHESPAWLRWLTGASKAPALRIRPARLRTSR